MGSLPTASHPPKEVASDGLGMAALMHREEELTLGEDFFMWLDPMNSHEALFMLDDEAE